jgi:hypothetical protein
MNGMVVVIGLIEAFLVTRFVRGMSEISDVTAQVAYVALAAIAFQRIGYFSGEVFRGIPIGEALRHVLPLGCRSRS